MLPTGIQGQWGGASRMLQQAQGEQPLLILLALAAVYIVLGMLYESLVHPLTILSTLPSAGVGALLGLQLLGMDFSLVALLGLFLLIGIVKKNAIMMIDFALAAQRQQGLSPRAAIEQAARLRFRPIVMTGAAAILGALPMALGAGEGAEVRQPLGVAIVGGLLVSQILTLYTTPVMYLWMDRLEQRLRRRSPGPSESAGSHPLAARKHRGGRSPCGRLSWSAQAVLWARITSARNSMSRNSTALWNRSMRAGSPPCPGRCRIGPAGGPTTPTSDSPS